MSLVRPVKVWVSVFDVSLSIGVQLVPKLPVPTLLMYSHPVSAALPPDTDEDSVSSVLPAVIVGVAGLGGRVAWDEALASSFEQWVSLYALNVQAVFDSRPVTVADDVPADTSDEQEPAPGAVRL